MIDSSFTSQGLLRELADYILNRSDTNPSFAETNATSIVSTAIGPNVIVATPKGDVYLNFDGIVLGGSSISNKTVAIKITRKMIKQLGIKLGIELLYPPKFSIEGLSKYFLDHQEGAIVGDEFTSMFKSTSRDWLKGILEFLSNLYDNYVDDYVTISRGIERVDFVYANFISATTFYLLKLMRDEDFFLQGTGVRILWDVDLERDEIIMSDIEAAEFFMDYLQRQERDEKIYEFVDKLAEIRERVQSISDNSLDQVVVLSFDVEAAKKLGIYRIKKLNEAIKIFNEDILNPDSGYLARLTENAIKLAGIHCISRHFTLEEWGHEIPEIIGEDVDWAIKKAEYHFQMYLKMKDLRDEIQSSYSTRGHKTDFNKVLSLIDKNGGYINITKVMQGTHWLRDDTLPILQAMVLSKIIEPKEVKQPRGRPSTVYVRYGKKILWVVKHAYVTKKGDVE